MLELASVRGSKYIKLWSRDFLHSTAFSAMGGQGKACARCMVGWLDGTCPQGEPQSVVVLNNNAQGAWAHGAGLLP